jgi:hypothetical protein
MFDAGNGFKPDGTPITDNDPHDAQTPSDVASEKDRLRHLVKQFGANSVPYVILDNEPSLWQLIHRDVNPTGLHADEIASRVIAYSKAVKAVSPKTQVVAPEEWGWHGYHYSGFDQQYAITHGMDHTPRPRRRNQGHGLRALVAHAVEGGGSSHRRVQPAFLPAGGRIFGL